MTSSRWLVGLVDFHSSSDTNRCIESIRKAAGRNNHVSILVVDNSGDYQPASNDIKVIRPGKNLGYAGAVNLMIHCARTLKSDFLWVLNNDCEVRQDSIDVYVDSASSTQFDIYTSLTTLGDAKSIWYGGGSLDRRSGRTSHIGYGQNVDMLRDNQVRQTDWASGANIVIPARTISSAPDWRGDFFLYLEELEWQVRSGYRVGIVGDDLVKHHAGSSTRSVSSSLEFFFSARNRIKIVPSLPGFSIPTWAAHWVIDFVMRPVSNYRFRRAFLAAFAPISTMLPGDKVVRLCRMVGGK